MNSVGTWLEFAAFCSGLMDPKYSCIAELVLFGFFCPQLWFLQRSKHILPGKTPAFSSLIGSLSWRKKWVVKLASGGNNNRSWPSGLSACSWRWGAGFGSQQGHEFFFFFNSTTWMRVFSQINKCQKKKKRQKTNQNKTKTKKGGPGAPLLGLAKSVY